MMRVLRSNGRSEKEVTRECASLDWNDEEKQHINKLHQEVTGKAFGLLFIFAFLCGAFGGIILVSETPIIRFTGLAMCIVMFIIVSKKLAPMLKRDLNQWLIDWYHMDDGPEPEESEEVNAS